MRLVLALLFFASVKSIAQMQPTLDTFNLRNGLKVYLLNHGQDSVINIKLIIDGGQKNESSCQVGYSEIIQHLLTETLKEKQKTLFKKKKKNHLRNQGGTNVYELKLFYKRF